MAISDTSITDVELINTFEQWRTKTNQIITVLNEQSDDDPVTSLLSADSDGGLTINTLSADIVTGASVTGSELTFTGGTVDFTGATTSDIGTVEKFALVEGAGATTTGASPDSKIERAQINECEINLNGQTLRANGASSIVLTGATVSDLGTVELVTINGGTINDVNVNITDADSFVTISSAGPHIFTGASFNNGTYNTPTTIGGITHSANISVNTASALVANVGAIFGSDVVNANVAIGDFPEYTHGGGPSWPTSSKGRLHIRSDFAVSGTEDATAVEGVADELVLENENDVGMTLLSDIASNAHIMFGDTADTDVGSIIYNHLTDSMHIVTDGANTVVIGNEYGGYMQIVGGDTIGTQAGKLHVNVGSSDATTGIWLDLNDSDQQAFRIDANTNPGCSANTFELRANTTTGHAMALIHGLGTGTSHVMSGSMLAITDNNSSTTARAVVDVLQDAVGATGTIGLKVTADGGTGISVVQNADKTGLLVSASGSASAGTKVVQFANSTADIFSTLANGTINFGGPSILSSNTTVTVNCRLGVRDTGGTVVNQT